MKFVLQSYVAKSEQYIQQLMTVLFESIDLLLLLFRSPVYVLTYIDGL